MLTPETGGHPHPGRSGEQGNVAFSMMVLMLLSMVGVALLARSQNELKTTAATSAGDRAVQAAEVGVAEAMATIANGGTGSLSGSVQSVDGTVTYRAEPLAPGRYQIESSATIDGTSRTIVVTISGSPLYPEVLFLTGPATLDGSTTSIVGDIGTNSNLVVAGRPPSGVQRLYGPDATCSGCPSPSVISESKEFGQPPAPSRLQPCPAGGRFPAVVDGLAGVPFECGGSEVLFGQTVVVANGPAVIRVADGTDLTFDTADVNPSGALDDLRIEVAGSGGAVRFDGSSVRGLVLAPDRRVTAASTQFSGALVAAGLAVPAAERFEIGGFAEVSRIGFQDWRVVTWRTDP